MEKGIATSTNPINMLDFNEDDDGDDKLEDNEMKREELDGLESPTRKKESDDNELNIDDEIDDD